jgi:hypothetical protein
VPSKHIFELIEHERLIDATSYAVQSQVPSAIYDAFVDSLITQGKMPVSATNAASLSLLATEFGISDLAAQCAIVLSWEAQFSNLSDRVSQLEHHLSSFRNPLRQASEAVRAQERAVESLRLQASQLKELVEGIGRAKEAPRAQSGTSTPGEFLTAVALPMREGRSAGRSDFVSD